VKKKKTPKTGNPSVRGMYQAKPFEAIRHGENGRNWGNPRPEKQISTRTLGRLKGGYSRKRTSTSACGRTRGVCQGRFLGGGTRACHQTEGRCLLRGKRVPRFKPFARWIGESGTEKRYQKKRDEPEIRRKNVVSYKKNGKTPRARDSLEPVGRTGISKGGQQGQEALWNHGDLWGGRINSGGKYLKTRPLVWPSQVSFDVLAARSRRATQKQQQEQKNASGCHRNKGKSGTCRSRRGGADQWN